MSSPDRDHAGLQAERSGAIGRGLVLLLAVACGGAIANNYYAQPLLATLARVFHVSNGTAGLLVTASQAGFVVGLLLLVPLGDLLERRRLITMTLLVAAGGLVLAATAADFVVLATALVIVGTCSVVAQIIVPMASSLAAQHERGRVVGTVMSGLLIGILLARTVGGLVATEFGWRSVFWFAAVAMLALAATLRRALPLVRPTDTMRYPALLRSVGSLVRGERVLRQRMALGAASFGCFSILWTSLAFLLSGPHYRYGNAVIGLFGLAGLAGALMAPIAGRLADGGHGRRAATGGLLILLASWGLLALGGSSLVALILGIVALDLGVQGLHISNQSTIFGLRADARSRLMTAYMASSFIGAATLSAASSALYASGGWGAVCALGAGTASVALAVWLITERGISSRAHPDPEVVEDLRVRERIRS